MAPIFYHLTLEHGLKIPMFLICKHIFDLIRHRGRKHFQSLSPSGAQGRKEWRTENPGWPQWCQTQGPCCRPQYNRLTSYLTHQKHRCLAERVGYYINRYIVSSYRILIFLCARYDVTPTKINRKYYGCDTSFAVRHGLICSKGGLIIAR